MDASESRANALQIIQNYRVPDLQALLKYARLSQQGNKRELFQRCKILLSSNVSSQLLNKINQIEFTRLSATKSHQINSNRSTTIHSSTITNLPCAKQIQFVHLPFYDKMRTIECINIPTDANAFPSLRFVLTEFDVDLILKNLARIFLRLVPTCLTDKQNDVLPPYLFVQCNGQTVINNNGAKTGGSQAHSIAFPTDITEQLIPKVNITNTLTYLWLQLPSQICLKNLPKSYTLAIQLVRLVSFDTLVNTILKREISSKSTDGDSDIEIEDIGLETTRQRVSLICPIKQTLIAIPVKSNLCSHLTCFDLRSFLEMNQKRLQWSCPICKKSATFETLIVDRHLQSIISKIPSNCSTVEIDPSTKTLADCQFILDKSNTDDNDDDDDEKNSVPLIKDEQDCIVLSSEDEDEDEGENSTDDLQTFSSILSTNFDEATYWQDIARFTYDLISNKNIEDLENLQRKRTHSMNSSLFSADDHQSKRTKSDDVDIITLSSSDDDGGDLA